MLHYLLYLRTMPLFKEWSIGDHGLAAIWKMEEPEAFFREHARLTIDIKSEKRRVEHLAGRYLLKHLQEDFPLWNIGKDEHDKPRIDNNEYFFSISHSWPYVAAMIDPHSEAGIDIQTWHSDIRRIQHKFLSQAEQKLFSTEQLITLAWCAKEAAYKWNGKRGVDFIEHLPIEYFDNNPDILEMMIFFKLSDLPQIIQLKGVLYDDFACAYVENSKVWVSK
jgi:hypothetical protein